MNVAMTSSFVLFFFLFYLKKMKEKETFFLFDFFLRGMKAIRSDPIRSCFVFFFAPRVTELFTGFFWFFFWWFRRKRILESYTRFLDKDYRVFLLLLLWLLLLLLLVFFVFLNEFFIPFQIGKVFSSERVVPVRFSIFFLIFFYIFLKGFRVFFTDGTASLSLSLSKRAT